MNYLNFIESDVLIFFYLSVIWSLFWKALALWQSSRRNQLTWFILLLFINTLGILEILYLLFLKEYDLKSRELLVTIKNFENKYLAKYLKSIPK